MNVEKFVFGVGNEKGYAKVYEQKKFTGQYVNTFEIINYIETGLNNKDLESLIKYRFNTFEIYFCYFKNIKNNKTKITIVIPNLHDEYNPEIKTLDEFVFSKIELKIYNLFRLSKLKKVVLISFATLKSARELNFIKQK